MHSDSVDNKMVLLQRDVLMSIDNVITREILKDMFTGLDGQWYLFLSVKTSLTFLF